MIIHFILRISGVNLSVIVSFPPGAARRRGVQTERSGGRHSRRASGAEARRRTCDRSCVLIRAPSYQPAVAFSSCRNVSEDSVP